MVSSAGDCFERVVGGLNRSQYCCVDGLQRHGRRVAWNDTQNRYFEEFVGFLLSIS